MSEDLCRYVDYAIRDITPRPEDALTWVRRIGDCARAVIWNAELPSNGTLPEEWLEELESAGLAWLREDQGRLPRERGRQCAIIRLITGSERTRRLAKYVTKGTSLLVDHLQSAGNYSQHGADNAEEHITIGFAASVVFSAIALVESLTDDLAGVDIA